MTSAATSDRGSPCEGSHPLVEGDARFCGDGDCYCRPTDACFADAEAEGCCDDVVLCGGLACMGSHPIVEGNMRFCEPGACYCGDPRADPPLDACYAMKRADACCPVEVVCYCAWLKPSTCPTIDRTSSSDSCGNAGIDE